MTEWIKWWYAFNFLWTCSNAWFSGYNFICQLLFFSHDVVAIVSHIYQHIFQLNLSHLVSCNSLLFYSCICAFMTNPAEFICITAISQLPNVHFITKDCQTINCMICFLCKVSSLYNWVCNRSCMDKWV